MENYQKLEKVGEGQYTSIEAGPRFDESPDTSGHLNANC
jgi:hypothetical protein